MWVDFIDWFKRVIGRKRTSESLNRRTDADRFKVAAIIPAYNEQHTIAQTIQCAIAAEYVDEVIVVSDGSRDRTTQIARRYPVTVVDLPYNVGKGGAMCAGVAHTDAQIILFLDADLQGLRARHVDALVEPLLHDDCDMSLGIFKGGEFWSDAAQVITPFLSGQRAMLRGLFERIPMNPEVRMGAEITIHSYAKHLNARIEKVKLEGVSNTHKEHKLGLVQGTAARAQMFKEIARAAVQIRKRQKSEENERALR